MDKNSNYWQEDFILQFNIQIQEAVKEQHDNDKRQYTVVKKGGVISWILMRYISIKHTRIVVI